MTEGVNSPRAAPATMPANAPTLDESGGDAPPSFVLRPRIVDEGEIARGGMGVIHRIFDRNIGRHAAMKIIDPELAALPSAARRFALEARITGQLDHPNIVPVYDFAIDAAGAPRHFTMKLVQGETLRDAIARAPIAARSSGELWRLLQAYLRVCDAVAFAHSRGVVHCDLKPENVMLGPYGQVYVMDWGIARVTGVEPADDEEQPAGPFGTPQYMAPEQAWGRVADVDARTDVFALGGILYQILTGEPPYNGTSVTDTLSLARAARVRAPAEVVGGAPLSPLLCQIALTALSAARELRYPDVDALKTEVERALRGGLWFGARTFAAGEVILREGDEGDAAYILTSGRCAAYRDVDGVPSKLREMGPGETFGEMALVAARPRSATVVAIDDVTAVVITRETLTRELDGDSWLGAIVRSIVARFRDLDDQLVRWGPGPTDQRSTTITKPP
jgi:serine/threonine-protein kinase